MIICIYKEQTPFPSTPVLRLSRRDVSVLIPPTSEPLCIGYSITATVRGKICCECFIANLVFLDAKEKEV